MCILFTNYCITSYYSNPPPSIYHHHSGKHNRRHHAANRDKRRRQRRAARACRAGGHCQQTLATIDSAALAKCVCTNLDYSPTARINHTFISSSSIWVNRSHAHISPSSAAVRATSRCLALVLVIVVVGMSTLHECVSGSRFQSSFPLSYVTGGPLCARGQYEHDDNLDRY